MFWPIPAIIRFSSERVLVFIRFMLLCNDGEISLSVVMIITTIKRRQNTPPPKPRILIIVIITTTDDGISPTLHNRINLIKTNTLSDENLMMAGIGRNM